MKLKSLRICGIGAVKDSSLPIEQLTDTDKIVAIRGRNGSGKTTHIECLPGVVYGSVPSHGLLTAMANQPDSEVEAVVETDQCYRMQRKINAARKTPAVEAYLFNEANEPLSDGHQKDFKEKIAELFPSEELYLASGFLAQKRDAQFLELKKTDRKKLFVQMIGCGHLQTISDAAGDRAKSLDTEMASQRTRAEMLQEQADQQPMAKANLRSAAEHHDRTSAELATAEENATAAKQITDVWLETNQSLRDSASDARAKLTAAKNAADTADAKVKELNADLVKLTAQHAALKSKRANENDLSATIIDSENARKELESIEKQIESMRTAREDWTEKRSEWIAKGHELRAAHDKLSHEYDTAVTEAKRRLEQLKCDHEMLTVQASKLDDVPCHGDGDYAGCPLIEMASTAKIGLSDLVEKLEAAEDEVERAVQDVDEMAGAKIELDEHIAKKPNEPPTPDDQFEKRDKLQMVVDSGDRAAIELARLDEVSKQINDLASKITEMRHRIDSAKDAMKSSHTTELEAEKSARAADDALAEHESLRPSPVNERRLAELRDADANAVAKMVRAEETLSACNYAKLKLNAILDEIRDKSLDLDDWRHLQKSFGRDGIQALEVDAAGPEVSNLINDLLHSCFGSRFSARLETTQLKSDGKGTKEIFDLLVIDSEMGREGSASDLSGGERVIVAEALSLAIAIFNTRKSSIPILDLWRDEVAGALDVENAPRYLTMLRKALDLGGFHRIYFIAHAPELWGMADQVILVDDGVAELEVA